MPSGGSSPNFSISQTGMVDRQKVAHDVRHAKDHTENPQLWKTALEKKRKPEKDSAPGQVDGVKRLKVRMIELEDCSKTLTCPMDRSQQLPAEIWHHIFTFLPPRALGCLLATNKRFHVYLDPLPVVSLDASVCESSPTFSLKPMKPDAIWQASRRTFWPRMPAPLQGKSEVDMWRLACSSACQFCRSKGDFRPQTLESQWQRGPGAKGVSFVIPFSIVACGTCLYHQSHKEIDVLLSSTTPSVLLPAVPAVLVTEDVHIIPPQLVQGNPSHPPVTKIFWQGHIDEIKSEFTSVKPLGSAAVNEWLKGLEGRGKQAMSDASRWEKWDMCGGLSRMRNQVAPSSHSVEASEKPDQGEMTRDFVAQTSIGDSLTQQNLSMSGAVALPSKAPPLISHTRTTGQQKRTKAEAAQLKADRRAEIERRALLLEPPLTADLLAHIPSFRAALQISTTLDDHAWELLKPRLLAQRAEAEKRKMDGMEDKHVPETKIKPSDENIKPSTVPTNVTDQDWDDIQGPVRARISEYADEMITKGWGSDKHVTKKDRRQFAADVLLYVRQRFYAQVAEDATTAIASGKNPVLDPPEGPWTQKLTLENMKWAFDMKIKQFTDIDSKGLFLCNICRGHKYYGLEGVVQHYAAKHTGCLSRGSVVVYWRAEWPEEPLFSPDPRPSRPINHNKGPDDTSSRKRHQFPAQPPHHEYPPIDPAYQNEMIGIQTQPSYPPSHTAACPYGPGAAYPYTYTTAQPSLPYGQDGAYHAYAPNLSYEPHPSYGAIGGYNNHYISGANDPYDSTAAGSAPVSDPYEVRVNLMAKVAKETWDVVSKIKSLPNPVKACAVIHHIAKVYQITFSEPAPLAMFMDGLTMLGELREMRSLGGLRCRACSRLPGFDGGRQNFKLQQLSTHFNKYHVEKLESRNMPAKDWRVEMVLLPDMSVLKGLPSLLVNQRAAFDTIADTLPWAFANVQTQTGAPETWDHRSTGERPLHSTHGERVDSCYDLRADEVPGASSRLRGADMVATEYTKYEASRVNLSTVQEPGYNRLPSTRPQSNRNILSGPYAEDTRRATSQHPSSPPRMVGAGGHTNTGNFEAMEDVEFLGSVPREYRRLESPHVMQPSRYHLESLTRGEHDELNGTIRYAPTRLGGEHSPRRDVPPRGRFNDRSDHHQSPGFGNRVTPANNGNNGHDLLDALEPRLDNAPRRERPAQYASNLGRGSQSYPSRSDQHGYHATKPDTRRRSRSPRYKSHGQTAAYRTRTPDPAPLRGTRVEPQTRMYYDDPRARPGPIVEEYELVEVRDAQGSYYVKRLVRPEERQYPPVYETRVEGRDAEQQRQCHDSTRPGHRPDSHVAFRRTPNMAHPPPPQQVDYEDYDPKYPAAGSPSF